MGNDLKKLIEALEKRIKELESLKKPNQSLFGSTYSQIGSSTSDLCLKTRGKVKILYGTKFIDLIKDGKINVDSKFIFKGEVGSKDGIYVDGENVWLKIGDSDPINLIGEIGITYVSFLGEQETSPEQKYTAYKNIGLIANTQEDVNITSGIVYIESENKLYIVNNGILEEFKVEFPNPITEQFVIAKNDTSIGSLLIQGFGKANSIAFNGLYIYNDGGTSRIESDSNLDIQVGDRRRLNISNNYSTFYNYVIGDMFQSTGATSTSGFRLYRLNSQSYLEVDNLTVRNKDTNESLIVYPETWFTFTNVIQNIREFEENNEENNEGNPDEEYNEDEDENDSSNDFNDEDNSTTIFNITLNQENTFEVGDTLIVYYISDESSEEDYPDEGRGEEEEEEESNEEEPESNSLDRLEEPQLVDVKSLIFTVIEVFDNNTIKVESNEAFSIDNIVLSNSYIYKINNYPIRVKDNNIDIINDDTIITRIGEINKEIIDNSENLEIKDYGIYSDIALFKNAAYTSDYTLEEDDNSSRFASTQWVRTFNNSLLERLESLEQTQSDIREQLELLEERLLLLENSED